MLGLEWASTKTGTAHAEVGRAHVSQKSLMLNRTWISQEVVCSRCSCPYLPVELISRIRRRRPMWSAPVLHVLNAFQFYHDQNKGGSTRSATCRAPGLMRGRNRSFPPSNSKGYLIRGIMYILWVPSRGQSVTMWCRMAGPCVVVNPLFMAGLFLVLTGSL